MPIESALLTKLLATSAVTNLAGQRIYYAGRTPTDVTSPYVVIQTISDVPAHSHGGYSEYSAARIQISLFASTYLGTKSLAAVISDAIDGFVGTWSGVSIYSCLSDGSSDLPSNNDSKISGLEVDYLINYNE